MNQKSFSAYCSMIFAVSAAVVVGLCTSCTSVKPDRFERQYHRWVPNGTPAKEAERIMKVHGFACSPSDYPSGRPWNGPALRCVRENRFLNRSWIVHFF